MDNEILLKIEEMKDLMKDKMHGEHGQELLEELNYKIETMKFLLEFEQKQPDEYVTVSEFKRFLHISVPLIMRKMMEHEQ